MAIAVAIFVVVSGYSISIKPLQHIHSRNYSGFAKTLSSFLFRRWLRLYLPFANRTLAYLTFWHVFEIGIPRFKPKGNWSAEVRCWASEFRQYTFVYRGSDEQWFRYNDQKWTVPLEFKSSMVVFSTLMAFSTQSTGFRVSVEAAMIAYFLYVVDGWNCAMPLAGMLICDLSLLAPTELPRTLRACKPTAYNLRAYTLAGFLIFKAYLSILAGVFCQFYGRGVYRTQSGFPLFWAACITVLLVPTIRVLRHITESRLLQHLGRVSFGLYLIHGPVSWVVGDGLYRSIRELSTAKYLRIEGTEHVWTLSSSTEVLRYGPLGLELGFLLVQFFLLPVTIILAEVVTRFVDGPTISLIHYLYHKTLGVKT